MPVVGSHTHGICAVTGLCCGPLGLFLAQDSVPDEDGKGTSQLLIWLSHKVLAAQRELGLLGGDPKARLDERDGSKGAGRGGGAGPGSLMLHQEAGRRVSRVPRVAS